MIRKESVASKTSSLQLKNLEPEDARDIFEWRNSPFLIARSTSQKRVAWEAHLKWIADSISSDERRLFIISIGDKKAGQVRFDKLADRSCVITVYLLEEYTGKGFGLSAILNGCEKIIRCWPETRIILAFVRDDNLTGQKGFKKVGFIESTHADTPRDHRCYELKRESLWQQDNERNQALYSGLLETHGISHKALNWGSETSQFRRFEVLSQVGEFANKSILDVGCGTGSLFPWLADRFENIQYNGIDITPEMVNSAKDRFPKAQFAVKDLLNDQIERKYDFVLASGIFCFRSIAPFEFMKAMIIKMYEVANEAVGFNSLSSWCENQEDGEFYANPSEVIDFCKTVVTTNVVFSHHYHPSDFTIYLYHKR